MAMKQPSIHAQLHPAGGGKTPCRGRFAPSPSGPLHFGSLVAALGSWLDARARDGVWLVRIEDIDPPREQPGAADDILRTLEAFGLHWDETVVWQSQRTEAYEAALAQLRPHLFWCTCTRAMLRAHEGVYPGTCHHRRTPPAELAAIRCRAAEPPAFVDRLQGEIRLDVTVAGRDPVLRRKDGFWAYQLAVVVDDGAQGITDVVRGRDLLTTTPIQVALQRHLGLPTPNYLHLPLVTDDSGRKLSKQNHAPAIEVSQRRALLRQGLQVLGLQPPVGLSAAELLRWGIAHWPQRRQSTDAATATLLPTTEESDSA